MISSSTSKSLVATCAVAMFAMVTTTSSSLVVVEGFRPRLPQKSMSTLSSATPTSLLMSSKPTSSSATALSASSNSGDEKPAFQNIAEFEYQELNIQLNAMKEQNVASSQLPLATRQEFEGYIRRIVNKRYSKSIPLNEIASKTKTANDPGSLLNTKWNLLFSTQAVVDESLPIDTTISIEFVSPTKLDYTLNFGKKVFGINQLTAVSSYEFDAGPVNPGLLTFNYEDITTNMFGMKNLGMGMFGGFLSGRSSYVPTAYMDGKLWIEQGRDNVSGYEYFTVYVKEEASDVLASASQSNASEDTTPLPGISTMGQQWDD